MAYDMMQITMNGQYIADKRRKIVDRVIDIFMCQSQDVDWTSHDLLITAVPKFACHVEVSEKSD